MNSSKYTYFVDNLALLKDLKDFLELRGISKNNSKHIKIAKFLKNAECEINITRSYASRKDFHQAFLILKFPSEVLREINQSIGIKSFESTIQYWVNDVLDEETGLTIMSTNISLLMTHKVKKKASIKMKNLVDTKISLPKNSLLPSNFVEQGRQMSEAYFILYILENLLRYFIEEVARNNFGDSFMDSIKISSAIKKRIVIRKEDERKNKWISSRGTSEIFYADFKDLGHLIQNNWEIFEEFFPSPVFVTSKLDDISKFRNLIAHNSSLSSNDFDILKSYYNIIIQQIETK